MKNLILCLACILTMVIPSTASGDFGLGLILGDPSGISAKISTGPVNSVNLVLGYDLNPHYYGCCRDNGQFYMGGDYVWYNYELIHVTKGRLPLYYGPGVNATFASNSAVGIRGVVGLEYQFAGAPFDLFIEIGPGIRVIPNTEGNMEAGFGSRFFF